MILDRRKFAGRDYQVESIVWSLYTYANNNNNNNNKNSQPPTLVTPSEYLWIRNNNNIKFIFLMNIFKHTCTQRCTINSETTLLKRVTLRKYYYRRGRAYHILLSRHATDEYDEDRS